MNLDLAIWLIYPDGAQWLPNEDRTAIVEWRDKRPQPSEKELQAAYDAYVAQQAADRAAAEQQATVAAADQVAVKAAVPQSFVDIARAGGTYNATQTQALLRAVALSLGGPLDVTQVGKDAVDATVDAVAVAATADAAGIAP